MLTILIPISKKLKKLLNIPKLISGKASVQSCSAYCQSPVPSHCSILTHILTLGSLVFVLLIISSLCVLDVSFLLFLDLLTNPFSELSLTLCISNPSQVLLLPAPGYASNPTTSLQLHHQNPSPNLNLCSKFLTHHWCPPMCSDWPPIQDVCYSQTEPHKYKLTMAPHLSSG